MCPACLFVPRFGVYYTNCKLIATTEIKVIRVREDIINLKKTADDSDLGLAIDNVYIVTLLPLPEESVSCKITHLMAESRKAIQAF